MSAKIFIDGDVGTTGLQIRTRLEGRTELELLRLSEERRKDPGARAEMLNASDVAILCLPDAAALEAVSLIESETTRVIDASTAHRTAEGWTYGFPEYAPGHAEAIGQSKRVANPGCYALTSVAMIHPLVVAGLLPADAPVSINAVSGYSGGGKSLIAAFEDSGSPDYTEAAYFDYALTLQHKHLPEITRWSGLARAPIFTPSVGRYAQGMIVHLPLALWSLPGAPTPADVHAALAEHYAGCTFVTVAGLEEAASLSRLEPQAVNGSNELRLHVFANEPEGQVVVAGLLDNLGKGASGSAVQNLNIMLGIDEAAGLAAA